MRRGSGTYAGSYAERVELGNQVQDALEQFTDKVRRRLRGVLVILFGSYVDGSFRLDSDVDVLVVADLPAEKRRPFLLRSLHEFPVRLQAFGYTPEKFLEMVKNDKTIARVALIDGRILHIDPNYCKQLLAAL